MRRLRAAFDWVNGRTSRYGVDFRTGLGLAGGTLEEPRRIPHVGRVTYCN